MKTFSAREYLKIDIASNFGLDKENWDTRINWFDAHEAELESQIRHAEKPALFYAGVQAWRDVTSGKPSGYPISLDATASGFQLLTCLIGDTQAAKLCNVISTGDREDVYTGVYDHMNQGNNIQRADVKQAIMTACYGSEAVPKEVFGEGALLNVFYNSMTTLAPYVWELNKAFLDMWNPEAMIHSWVMPDNFHVHVKVMGKVKERVHFLNEPYDVIRKVNMPTEEGRSLGANTTHSVDSLIVRELTRRCSYDRNQVDCVALSLMQHGRDTAREYDGHMLDKDTRMVLTLWDHYKASGYLSARILDHITNDNARYVDRQDVMDLIDSLPVKAFEILSIHDAFRVLPAYGNDLRKQYINQLVLIAKSNLLDFLVSQIIQRPVQIGKADADMWKQIVDSEYALS